jgi:hypothetical protein
MSLEPCEPLKPGLYRVLNDGSIHHVTKVEVTHTPITLTEFILAVACFGIVILIGLLLWRNLQLELVAKNKPSEWGDYHDH